jgi:thioredoxin reductase
MSGVSTEVATAAVNVVVIGSGPAGYTARITAAGTGRAAALDELSTAHNHRSKGMAP